ncbi:MAG: glycosyltransferase [Planctomycetota bacterium]
MRVNTLTGLLDGGAAVGAIRLHLALRGRGVDSRLFYPSRLSRHDSPVEASSVAPFVRQFPGDLAKSVSFRMHRVGVKRALKGRSKRYEIFTSPRGSAASRWKQQAGPLPETTQEVMHLHWISKFLDWATFFPSLSSQAPVIWTLHDMNPFTGGCHFSHGCTRFRSGCGRCPQLAAGDAVNRVENDLSHQFFVAKQGALQGIDLDVVAPSRWMLNQAEASAMFPAATRFHHIPYGIPLDDYHPVGRGDCRAALDIDDDTFVFLFGAAELGKERKGMKELIAALSGLNGLNRSVLGLFFGSGELIADQGELPPVRSVGYVQDLTLQRMIYSAADVFVLPSLEDNLPFTGLESIACGTPIVAFNNGGIPDYVLPGRTGLLAESGCIDELGSHLRTMAEQPTLALRLGRQAREFAVAHHDIDHEASKYESLYAATLQRSSRVA